jgi:hypothetical protein
VGNARLIYTGGQIIDLGASGFQSVEGGRAFDGTRLPRTGDAVVERLFDSIRFQAIRADALLLRTIRAFESYALAGGAFAVANDSAQMVDTVINADPAYLEKVTNGDLEAWDAAGTTPTGMTVSLSGSTTISRENKREDVFAGQFAARWDVSASGDRSLLKLRTTQVPAGVATRLTYRHKYDPSAPYAGAFQVTVQNVANAKYLQVNGTWSAGIAYLPSNLQTLQYAQTTLAFTMDSVAGELDIEWGPAFSGSGPQLLHLDDIHVWVNSFVIPVRDTNGIGTNTSYRFMSRTRGYTEVLLVTGFVPDVSVTVSQLPRLQFEARDIVRSESYWPYLKLDQKSPIIQELPGGTGLFALDMKCIEAESGRY